MSSNRLLRLNGDVGARRSSARRRWLTFLRPGPQARRPVPQETPAPEPEPAKVGIKSEYALHSWIVTGGYDPALDGEDPGFGRAAIRCVRCGEERRVGCPVDDPALSWGCVRPGFTGRYVRGDQVRVAGRRDYFLNYLPNGHAATANSGGRTYVQPAADLEPVLCAATVQAGGRADG